MTPRLLLLTGPAAGDVAAVFRKGMHTARLGWNFPYWDEVRDYWKALKIIELAARGLSEGFRPQSTYHDTAKAIHSLPGGEEWLVGLVLPECPIYCCYTNGMRHDRASIDLIDPDFTCEPCRKECGLPDRLAILAPDPPRLLVERVRAWDGEFWECEQPRAIGDKTYPVGILRDHDELHVRDTWLEAVRAALGEP